jgi:hypothetical protein
VVIHYPSEDYPCLCENESAFESETCAECQHPAAKHTRARVCKPVSGEICACRT